MSPATVTSGTAAAQHVPAWKRLGLKLKYAKETAEPSGPASADTGDLGKGGKRHSSSYADETASQPSKKQRLSPEDAQISAKPNSTDDNSHSPSRPKVKNVDNNRKASRGKHQTFDSEE